MTSTQRLAIAALVRTILAADLPTVVKRSLFDSFRRWPESDRLEAQKLVYTEAEAYDQVRSTNHA
jgi:hypothetical protein